MKSIKSWNHFFLSKTTSKNVWKALIILIIGLTLTLASTLYTNYNVEAQTETEFEMVCNEIELKIATRLHAHAQLLRTGAAFFSASDTVTRQQWREFIKNAKIDENLPGIQGVGFSMIIPKNQLKQHLQNTRNEGFPDYEIKPAGEREVYTSIIYLEPFTDRNLRAFGYDMFSEPVRRKAMEISRDNDIAMLSGKVLLLQETNQDVQPGTLMYVPVYTNRMPVNTVEQRRAAIKGWVYSPYRMNDLMQGILGRWDKNQKERIHLQIYDDSISIQSFIYDSKKNDTLNQDDSHSLTLTVPVEFNGKKWTLCFFQHKEQISYFDSKVIMVFISGIVISFLLFGLFKSLINTKARAIQIARKLTAELKESEEKHRLLIENNHDIIYTLTADGVFMFVSPAWTALLGHPVSEVSGQPLQQFVHRDDLPQCLAFLQKVIETGQRQQGVEYRMKHTDGTWFWHTSSAVPLRNDAGIVIGFEGTARDITERRHAEAALRESEKLLLEMTTQVSGVVYQFYARPDGEKGFYYISEKSESILGLKPELDGYLERFAALVIPEHREGFIKSIEKSVKELNEWKYEGILQKPSGEKIWFSGNSNPTPRENELVFNGIVSDITDRKLAEELLQQTRQNYESFFNTINDFLFVLDEQGNIIHTNNTVINRLGYNWEELSGKSVLLVHPPERREEAGRIVGEMLQGLAEFCPVPLITKSGAKIPVETRVTSGFWDGKPVIFGVTKDISKLRLSEEKFSKLFHLNPSACGLNDLETHQYLEVNEAFYALLGFDKGEVIGKTARELGILSSETAYSIMLKADSAGNVTNVEAGLKAKNGDIKQVLLSSENIYIQDKKYRFTVVHDITDRKKAEQEINLKNEQLRKINSEKDKFFSIIAHDLRSPFNGFLGLTEIMAKELSSLTSTEIQKIAVNLHNSATHLFRLLENLLHWARMKQGLIPFNPEVTALPPIVFESVEMVHDSAKSKRIRIHYDFADNIEVFADTNMLQTIIRNLVSNAIKFTPRGGQITLCGKENSNKNIEIAIKDNGIGMSPLLVEQLFRIDIQTGRRGTEDEPSTGLGLLLCKEFIEKHGGKIWVESIEGKGSTFIFTIPYERNSDRL